LQVARNSTIQSQGGAEMSTPTRVGTAHRLVVAGTLSIAACILMVACSGEPASPTSPSGASGGSTAANDDGTKGVICHATGSASNPYTGVDVGVDTSNPPILIFSNNGHLDANGSPTSGHEEDRFIGPDPPNKKKDCNCKDHPELPACGKG
jgi:hypothetical protein